MTKLKLTIKGMTCPHCIASVSRTLKSIAGVTVNDVQLGSATIEFDEAKTTAAALSKAVTDEGYPVMATH